MNIQDINEYPIISFPIDWIYVYRTILLLITDEHKCPCTSCKENIGINAYHSFIIATSAYNLGKVEDAKKLINEIKESLIEYKSLLKFPFGYTINDKDYIFYEDGTIELLNAPVISLTENFGWYFGTKDVTDKEMETIDLFELYKESKVKAISGNIKVGVETDEIIEECTDKVFYMIIPSTGEITQLNATYNGISYDLGKFGIKVHNDNLIINNMSYKCYYGYAINASESSPIIYKYRISFDKKNY